MLVIPFAHTGIRPSARPPAGVASGCNPHNTPSIELYDYTVAAQCLLTPPSHPHKEQYDYVDVHTMIPWGLSNAQATEWSWEFTNHLPLGDVWRSELHIVLENFRSVHVTIDPRTGRAL